MDFVTKFQQSSKSRDIMGGIDKGQPEIQCLYELEIGMSQLKDIDLNK